MNWTSILAFTRGPLFTAALLVFLGGMAYRLLRILLLGWNPDRIPARGSRTGGALLAFLRSLIVWPFIPWFRNTFTKNPVIYLAGGLFHLGLFVVIFLGTAHVLVWKSLLGFVWPSLPLPIVDWFAAAAIVALIALFINRLIHPVLRLISGPAEWLNLLFVFFPMISGYMLTHHLVSPYEMMYSIHMVAVDTLLVWIPLSRISHFLFYFFAKTIHGVDFGKRAVTP